MAGKRKNPQKKEVMNAAEMMQYRQQKIAKEARLCMGLQPRKRAHAAARPEPVKIVMMPPVVVNRRHRGWEYIVFNPFKAFKEKVVEVPVPNTGHFTSPFSSHISFEQKLVKKGYVFLGSGNFSNVYGKPGSQKVLKITHNLSDSWFYYAKWANTNGWGGKYAPKMYSHKFFEKGNFAVAVMERLHSRHQDNFSKGAHVVVELLARYGDNPTANTLADLVAPGLPKFMDDAKKLFRFDDDHGQNLMVRSDGTLVWNDPVAWGAYKTANDNIKTRLRAKDLAPVALAA